MGIAEAMSLGLPVIGGRKSGGVPWVIGEGGITADVTSPQDIAIAAERVLEDEKLWERLSAAAIKRSREIFSASVVASQYEEQYQRALYVK